MNDWEMVDRRLGPAETVKGPAQENEADAAPSPPGAAPLSAASIVEPPGPVVLPAVLPPATDEVAESNEWSEDDVFEPRFCTVCHRQIPHIVSERQEMCNACLAQRGLAVQPLPMDMGLAGDCAAPRVHCPMCAGTNVERNWKQDWISTAVDIVSDAASLGAVLLGGVQGTGMHDMESNREAGRVKVLRHHCMSCGYRWVE